LHDVSFTALLVQAESPAFAFGMAVLNLHGADPGERIVHLADERTISEACDRVGSDRGEELARFVRREDRCLAALD
jgi:hypothetical protein